MSVYGYPNEGNNLTASEVTADSIRKSIEKLKSFDKGAGPDLSRAYLVVPPEFIQSMKLEPLSYEPANDQKDAFKYAMMGFGLSPRFLGIPVISCKWLSTAGDSRPEPKVIWKDTPAVEPTPFWQTAILWSCIASILLLIFSLV